MRTKGMARATTKEIAHAVGLSEGALYKHFTDKPELFLTVLHERVPGFRVLADALAASEGPLRERLIAIARAATEFYAAGFPMSASIFSEPQLLTAHRESLRKLNAGPHRPVLAVAAMLRTEQEQGEIDPVADCDAAAGLLLGACFQRAFLDSFEQKVTRPATVAIFAESIIDTLLAGLRPRT
jgi:AcrR family transcriptional regulator